MKLVRCRLVWLLLSVLLTLSIATPSLAQAPDLSAGSGCWECWGPGLIDPCRNTLYDVDIVPGTSGGEAWAVGVRGTILHYAEGQWTKMNSPTTVRLYGVAAANSNLALAVGQDGVALKWNGTSWSTLSTGTDNYMRDVIFVPGSSGATGWAVSDKYGIGLFHRWNGTKLETKINGEYLRFGGTLNHLSAVDGSDIWAVGELIGEGIGSHWDGREWSPVIDCETELESVHMVSSNDGWAVGEDGVILHYDGESWTDYASPADEDLNGVAFGDADNGWAVGNYGEAARWDGASWQSASVGVYYDLRAIDMEGSGFGWAVGAGGTILRLDGSTWTTVTAPDVSGWDDLHITPGSGGKDAWIAGSSQSLLHWNGATWESVQGADGVYGYHAVRMVNANDGWAAGWGGKMAHWDGNSWQLVTDVESIAVMEVPATDDGWGLGWDRIHHWEGASWTEVESSIEKHFYGSHMLAADDIWASGEQGTVVQYDGETWQDHSIDYGWSLWDIGFASPDEGFTCGSYGNLWKWNGTRWSEVDHGLTEWAIRTLDVVPSDVGTVGWALGDNGVAMRYRNGSWTLGCTEADNLIERMQHASATEAWAVGDYGVIMHWGDYDILELDEHVYLPIINR